MYLKAILILLVAIVPNVASQGNLRSTPKYSWKVDYPSCNRGYWTSGCGQPEMAQKARGVKCYGSDSESMWLADDNKCAGMAKPTAKDRVCPATKPCPRCKGCKRDGGCWKTCGNMAGSCARCDAGDGRKGACCMPGAKGDPMECRNAQYQFDDKKIHTCALVPADKPSSSMLRYEPPLPGIMPGKDRPHVILAADINYPPYAYMGNAAGGLAVDGFGADVANSLSEVCDIDVTVSQTSWGDCWNNNKIGPGLLNGYYHGCMTYTHTFGVRNRYLEFSAPILENNKGGGLIARLDPEGKPMIDGNSDLSGLRVVDVVGWAPTEDGLLFVKNTCQGGANFKDFTFVKPTHDTGNANDDALLTLLDGKADVMWVYDDQARNYQCTDKVKPAWNCDLWAKLGKDFAYIHTGFVDYAVAGTTLSIAKKGAGLSAILDPCIEKLKATKTYYELCEENGLTGSCFKNSFFPKSDKPSTKVSKTNQLKTTCKEGYCPCPAS